MRKHLCRFCKKGFSTEKILLTHLCTKKKRFQEQETTGAMLGFRVFQRFWELTSQLKKPKTVEDFIDSSYYLDFVKFGRYLVELRPLQPDEFVDFVINESIPIKHWKSDEVYNQYLAEFIKKEKVERAVERTILELQEWTSDNGTEFCDFFKVVPPVEATWLIKSGRISPWVLYLAETSDALFSRMNEEQGKLIQEVIDPSKWQVKFMLHKEDVEFVKELLKKANL